MGNNENEHLGMPMRCACGGLKFGIYVDTEATCWMVFCLECWAGFEVEVEDMGDARPKEEWLTRLSHSAFQAELLLREKQGR